MIDLNKQTIYIYIVDTSSLIELKTWYRRESFKSLWEKIEELITNNRFKAPIQVLHEVERKDDELKDWCRSWKDKLFDNINTQLTYVQMIIKKHPKLINPNKPYKDECADPYIIALAMHYKTQYMLNCDNVTYREPIVISEENIKKEHSLTNICKCEGIETLHIYELPIKEGWKF